MPNTQDDPTVNLIRTIIDHMDQDESEHWSLDKDSERWNFTPENFNTFHELIKPNFNTPKEES